MSSSSGYVVCAACDFHSCIVTKMVRDTSWSKHKAKVAVSVYNIDENLNTTVQQKTNQSTIYHTPEPRTSAQFWRFLCALALGENSKLDSVLRVFSGVIVKN